VTECACHEEKPERLGYVFMLPIMAVEYDFNTTQTGFLSALSYAFVFVFAPLGGMLQATTENVRERFYVHICYIAR